MLPIFFPFQNVVSSTLKNTLTNKFFSRYVCQHTKGVCSFITDCVTEFHGLIFLRFLPTKAPNKNCPPNSSVLQ